MCSKTGLHSSKKEATNTVNAMMTWCVSKQCQGLLSTVKIQENLESVKLGVNVKLEEEGIVLIRYLEISSADHNFIQLTISPQLEGCRAKLQNMYR